MGEFPALGALLGAPTTWFVLVVALVAGVVRGFSGFGGALIFIPLTAAALGPRVAVPTFYISDAGSALPYGLAMIPKCRWRQVLPLLIGSWITQPLGVLALGYADPAILRWTMSVLVTAMLIVLITGWRYTGTPRVPLTIAVGLVAGFLNGAIGLSGPVVIAYWLGGRDNALTMRANMMVYYALSAVMSDVLLLGHGLFTWPTVVLGLLMLPLYSLGLFGGARIFHGSSDKAYRIAAYAIVALSAVISLPLFDGIFR